MATYSLTLLILTHQVKTNLLGQHYLSDGASLQKKKRIFKSPPF